MKFHRSFIVLAGVLAPHQLWAANPPIDEECDECKITEELIWDDFRVVSKIVSRDKVGLAGWKCTVEFSASGTTAGFYLPECANNTGTPDQLFTGFYVPTQQTKSFYFNSLDGKKSYSSDVFRVYYNDPCTGERKFAGSDTGILSLDAPPKEPNEEEPKEGEEEDEDPPIVILPPDGDDDGGGGGGGEDGEGGGEDGGGDPPIDPPGTDGNCGETFTPGQCMQFENPDTRKAEAPVRVAQGVQVVAENISFSHRKNGFLQYNYDPATVSVPKYYLQESATTSLTGGTPESPVGGSITRRICPMTSEIVTTAKQGNPSYYGFSPGEDITLTETEASGSYPVSSYDDCPNQESDGPGTMQFAAYLSEEYTTERMRSDAFLHAWDFKGTGYYRQEPASAKLLISDREDTIQYAKTKYKLTVPFNSPLPVKLAWVEVFTPKDPDPDDDVIPEKEYKFLSEEITSRPGDLGTIPLETRSYEIDPSENPDKEGTWDVILSVAEISDCPKRFWTNNDQDDVETDEPVEITAPDHADDIIKSRRDLEDFARMNIIAHLPIADLKAGTYQIGLKWENVGWGAPKIRCWQNQSPEGNKDYLFNAQAATTQIAKDCLPAVNGNTIVIPKEYWNDASTVHLIFEGISKGEGMLAIVVLDENNTELGIGGGAPMKLMDVRNMYERAKIKNEPDDIPNPWSNRNPPVQSWEWHPDGHDYVEDPDVIPVTCVFVHGWRMPIKEFQGWADTSYKRLWHHGYKGKFYAFRWATYSGEDSFPGGYFTYNPSEYRAWLCAPALADFVNQLPNVGRKQLFAHSMGNVIAGAALRAGMIIDRYALCNAAMAAMAYDSNYFLRYKQGTTEELDDIYQFPAVESIMGTPDTDPNPYVSAVYGLQDKFTKHHFPGTENPHEEEAPPTMINFGLPNDSALGKWTSNNKNFKPEANKGYSYTIGEITPAGASQAEAMGYLTKSLTRTVGADLRTKGAISEFVNMESWGTNVNHGGFGDTHSAEWIWNYQSTNLFWAKLYEKLELDQ